MAKIIFNYFNSLKVVLDSKEYHTGSSAYMEGIKKKVKMSPSSMKNGEMMLTVMIYKT